MGKQDKSKGDIVLYAPQAMKWFVSCKRVKCCLCVLPLLMLEGTSTMYNLEGARGAEIAAATRDKLNRGPR